MSPSHINIKRKVVYAIIFFILILIVLFWGKRGFWGQYHAFREKKRLENQIQSLESKRDTLKSELKNLDNPETIEKIAREEYGMAKKDEKVYRVVPKEKKE